MPEGSLSSVGYEHLLPELDHTVEYLNRIGYRISPSAPVSRAIAAARDICINYRTKPKMDPETLLGSLEQFHRTVFMCRTINRGARTAAWEPELRRRLLLKGNTDLRGPVPSFLFMPGVSDPAGYPFELLLGCLLGSYFTSTKFDEPDLLFDDGSSQWGVACKSAGRDSKEENLAKRVVEGAEQIQSSNADAGVVVIDISRREVYPNFRATIEGRHGFFAMPDIDADFLQTVHRYAKDILSRLKEEVESTQRTQSLASRPKCLAVQLLGQFLVPVKRPPDVNPSAVAVPLPPLSWRTASGLKTRLSDRVSGLVQSAYFSIAALEAPIIPLSPLVETQSPS